MESAQAVIFFRFAQSMCNDCKHASVLSIAGSQPIFERGSEESGYSRVEAFLLWERLELVGV